MTTQSEKTDGLDLAQLMDQIKKDADEHKHAPDNGAPGFRPRYDDHWYAAYVLDPDGHNIEAVCRLPLPR